MKSTHDIQHKNLMKEERLCTHSLLERVNCYPVEPTPMYSAMLAIWHLRKSLQKRYPLHKNNPKNYLTFLAWCVSEGRKDYAILNEIIEWNYKLNLPVRLPEINGDKWAGAFNIAMILIAAYIYRGNLFPLMKSRSARDITAKKYFRGRRHELRLSDIPIWQKKRLYYLFKNCNVLAKSICYKKHNKIPSEELIFEYRLDDLRDLPLLSDALITSQSETSYVITKSFIFNNLALHTPLFISIFLYRIKILFRRDLTENQLSKVTCLISNFPKKNYIIHQSFGVNLYGYAHGELGIGEDIRQVAIALQSLGVPVCIINFKPGSNISQEDRSVDPLIVTEPRYGINVFCMTGIETTRYVCEMGLTALKGRYNIGLWPWELPDWPESCRHAYACVDEVWGISQYTAHAHRHAAPRPVLPMGLPVELGPIAPQTRKDFGLPEKTFLFYFAFDINSNAARKNPDGLIKAFQKAFPAGKCESVGLVLKISHPETGCKLWKRIRKIAQCDNRVHVIEKTMRRPELLSLFRACDCLVSLHRAEGFGRCIAEALLLGKQVITTGFSGNLDFCQEPRVALVSHSMRKVEAKDYMWGEGQMWAEPDLDHAAELMRSIWQEPRELGSGNYDFSPETIGQRYKARLQEIWQQHAKQKQQG